MCCGMSLKEMKKKIREKYEHYNHNSFTLVFDTAEELRKFIKEAHPTNVSGADLAYARSITDLEEVLPRTGVFLIEGNFYRIRQRLITKRGKHAVKLIISKLK